MRRATSATVYGPSWIDPARQPMVTARRAYGLRTASHPDGWAPAYGRRPTRRTRREVVGTDGLVAPVAPVAEDAPVRRFVRVDFEAERKSVAPIPMGTLFG